MRRLVIFLSCVFFFAACSNLAYLTKNVKPTTSDSYVLLESDTTYVVKRGVGVTWKEGFQKGVYRPELENEFGTFYRGPAGCVIQFMDDKSMGPFDGGIWVPKDRINSKPMIYYYFNYNSQQAMLTGGPVVSAMLLASEGDITFIPPVDQNTFLNDIRVTNLPLKSELH